ncbi:hypothetical protein CTI12_AA242180 [Artemisia annua]|nr:hypothetical protein CTI12_AA242180 [Artemisia annua]
MVGLLWICFIYKTVDEGFISPNACRIIGSVPNAKELVIEFEISVLMIQPYFLSFMPLPVNGSGTVRMRTTFLQIRCPLSTWRDSTKWD